METRQSGTVIGGVKYSSPGTRVARSRPQTPDLISSYLCYGVTIMQAGPRAPGSSQPPVKIYNAVYSSVQVINLFRLCLGKFRLTRSRHDPGL